MRKLDDKQRDIVNLQAQVRSLGFYIYAKLRIDAHSAYMYCIYMTVVFCVQVLRKREAATAALQGQGAKK